MVESIDAELTDTVDQVLAHRHELYSVLDAIHLVFLSDRAERMPLLS